MNPQLTITILAVLLLANSITTLVYWFRSKTNNELNDKLKLSWELHKIRSEQIKKLTNSYEALQSKLNAAKDALK